MTDTIASLIMKIDASQAEQGAASLDKLTAAGGKTETQFIKAEGAAKGMLGGLQGIPASLQAIDARTDALRASVDPLAMAMKRANAEMHEADALYKAGAIGAAEYGRYVDVLENRLASAVAAQNLMNAAQAKGARSIGLTAAESLNLSRQMADVGVSLAMGMNPLMVMIQQGPQVADIFGQASARGVGFSAALRGMVAAAGPLLPILVALGAVAAVLTGGVALVANQLNKTSESADELQKRLGLTDEQMKKVKNTSVTMGDVVAGSAKFAADELWAAFGPTLTKVGAFFQEVFDAVARTVVGSARNIVGVFGGAFEVVRGTWRMLPAVMGDAVITAANLVVRGVEAMINKAIAAINLVIGFANSAAGALGLAFKLPTLEELNLGRFEDAFAGAMDRLGTTSGELWKKGFTNSVGGFDAAGARWLDDIFATRDARVMKEAGDPAKPKAAGASNDNDPLGLAGIERGFNDAMGAADEFGDRTVKAMLAAQLAAARAREEMSNWRGEAGSVADILTDIDNRAQDAASGISGAFGKVGRAIGDVTTLMTRYAARQADLTERRKAEGVTAQEVARIDRETTRNRIGLYGDLLGAAKGFVDEQSDAYKALQAVEAGYRAWQLAASIQAMVQTMAEAQTKVAADAAAVASHTGAAVAITATDAATTSSGIAAGAARMFANLGPYAFPVVAAMLATMASLGASSGGSVGGVSVSQRRQDTQGTGSVLGDASAKSESIANSLEIVASNTNRDLEYSNAMLRALRSIDDQIGAVAAALARSLGAGGALDTSSLGLGTTTSGPSGLMKLFSPLASILPGLFGTTTTKKLQDQGISFGGGSLSDILSGGLSGEAYQQILETTKKKAFGVTYSEKTKKRTLTSDLDSDFLRQTELLIGSLRDGVIAAAGILGVEGAAATLASFQVNLGKISLKDMSGAEIEEALQAVFSKLGDEMAGAVLPALKIVQKVGEGLFETLNRVARQYQVVDVTLSSIGKTFGMVGVSSIGARERLIDLFGSLDDFTEQVGFYAETFLTEAERLAPVQSAVTAELARLGLAGVKTRDQFKSVVQGLDVSTAAGSELFAALMSLAPAFAKITEETQAVTDAREALSGAYGRESEALNGTLDTFRTYAADLRKFRDSLYSGPAAALSPEAQYMASKAEFERVAGLASAGNEQALGDLQGVSQAYLDASKAYYASSAGYFADLALVRDAVTAAEASALTQVGVAEQQLEELKALVSGFIDINESTISVRDAVNALTVALGFQGVPNAPAAPVAAQQATANDNSNVVEAVAELRQELASLNARMDALLNQRAAIHAADLAQMQEQTDRLSRQLRELTA